ncbi:hypothetical protein, partial [uncultured Actinomyces sp.]|uniref:hypothetical protein n=1 Tax=uncultured Actinomyces sp. TaxID=249061 RepID=UPI0025F91CF5
ICIRIRIHIRIRQGECEQFVRAFALISRPQQPTGRDSGTDGDRAVGGCHRNSRNTGLLGY